MEFALQTSGSYQEVLAAARWAEEQGLAAFALPDHYLRAGGDQADQVPASDALIQLGGLARETSTIPLVMLVSPITFRHPAVYLKSAVTIDEMSGGRFTFGLGTGWLEQEHEIFGIEFFERPQRFAMLEEALAYLRAGLSKPNPGFEGERYSLQAFDSLPRPAGDLPLLVGGVGKVKTPRLAGRYADEFNVYPSDLDGMRERIDRARKAALEAGRDPDAILLSSAGQVQTAPTEAEYGELLGEIAAEAGITVEELEAGYEMRGTPRGTHEQVAEMMAGYASLGIERFYLQRPPDFDREAELALMETVGP
jgi:alkanesulfonate monooxygenase SsuD/methylene tetrahydromethanopterin reductase-like flavin-dependent oxidoreductase (luciferase family)